VNRQMTLGVVILCVLGWTSFAWKSLAPLQDERAVRYKLLDQTPSIVYELSSIGTPGAFLEPLEVAQGLSVTP